MRSQLRHSIPLREPFLTALRDDESWASFWASRSLFWFTERSGLTLTEHNGNDASIITSAHLYSGAGYYTVTPVVLNIADGFHISGSYLYKANLATNIARVLLSFRATGSDSNEGVWQLYITIGNKFEFFYRANSAYRQLTTTLTPVDDTWYDFDIHVTGGKVNFTINTNLLASPDFIVPTSTPADKFVTIAALANAASPCYGYITNMYLSSGVTYWRYPLMEQNNRWQYDVGPNAAHVSRTGVGNFGAFVNTKNSYLLDNGYSVYTKVLNNDIIVPFADDGTEIIPVDGVTIITGFVKSYSRAGNLIGLNMSPCKIRLPNNEITDRSDTDSFNNDCRAASDYDAVNTTDVMLSNLTDIKILSSWLNVGYKGRIFPSVTNQLNGANYEVICLNQLMIMLTDKTGSEEGRIITETENRVYCLLDEGSYMYDDNNYVILNG